MSVDEKPDFTTLSAFVDGELDWPETEWVRAWIAHDSDVARQVETLQALKADVAGLSFDVRPVKSPPPVSAQRRGTFALIAASLLVVIVLGGYRMGFDGPANAEERMAQQVVAAYENGDRDVQAPIVQTSVEDIELFRSAGLNLKAQERLHFGGSEVAHRSYVGPGGCRVSVFEFPAHAIDEEAVSRLIRLDEHVLSAGWKSSRNAYLMVARRMDEKRFDAIAAALKNIDRDGRDLIVAGTDIPRSTCMG